MSNFKDFLDNIDDHNEIVETIFNIDESKFSAEFQEDIVQLKRILNELPKKLQDYTKGDTAKDKNVLDAFSNVGGFALHACKYGAKSVVACDISQRACDEITNNAKLNGYTQLEAKCVDVFDFLHSEEANQAFDVIILDPPAFSKNKESLKKAYRGYKEINMTAMKIIKEGGYLLTFSCSQHMTPDLFMQMINEAAHDAKRTVQFLDFRIQAPDHPALLQSEEQLYLKCIILRVK